MAILPYITKTITTMKTVNEVRRAFWAEHPQYNSEYRAKKRQNQYSADVRCSFVAFVEHLRRDNVISEDLAFRVTL